MKNNTQRFFINTSKPLIIKLIFPALLLLFSFMPKGKEKSDPQFIKKEIVTNTSFQNVYIIGNVSVILTSEPAGTVVIEGNENDVNNTKYKNKNSELTIDAGKKKRFSKITIYLSANTLKQMLINGDGNVASMGTIKTDNLQIWLNGNIDVDININGKVSVDSGDGYELTRKSL